MERRATIKSQNNLEKKSKTGGKTCPYFKISYKATVMKMCYYHENRHPWCWCNNVGSPKLNLTFMSIFYKDVKTIQWRKKLLLRYGTRGAWVVSRLSVRLWLRSWSQGPGIEPHIKLPAQQWGCFSLCCSNCLCPLSLSNKQLKLKKRHSN